MPCSCQKNKTQYEVVDADGKRVFGPTPYKTTADAMAARGDGREVREVAKK
ncbi:hypothetical protein [Streptomyces canus]|uniref:hypothetical protein n=1 Tax=Streptomyces canus TaxID=58343 RepID=UPI00277EAF87|nr:hypothetical protein [Streptomyces canus]MDQ0761999.1 hypothetical protein [Streptomyces canus]